MQFCILLYVSWFYKLTNVQYVVHVMYMTLNFEVERKY